MAKYSKAAEEKVGKVMKEFEAGKLRSRGSGEKVTSRKQAIAIGISEARAEGKKVPKAPAKKSAPKKTAKKAASKKVATKKTAVKKSTGKKSS